MSLNYKEIDAVLSELDLKDNYELILLVCIMMYSKLPNSIYDIILLDTDVYKNGIKFKDFIIKERK